VTRRFILKFVTALLPAAWLPAGWTYWPAERITVGLDPSPPSVGAMIVTVFLHNEATSERWSTTWIGQPIPEVGDVVYHGDQAVPVKVERVLVQMGGAAWTCSEAPDGRWGRLERPEGQDTITIRML
jgi:hypothetical protein